MNSKKAVITILGLIGGNDNHQKATYYFEDKKEEKKDYFNTFPLLIEKFSNDYKIVPLYTKEAKRRSILWSNRHHLRDGSRQDDKEVKQRKP